jgi:hypothetical protein
MATPMLRLATGRAAVDKGELDEGGQGIRGTHGGGDGWRRAVGEENGGAEGVGQQRGRRLVVGWRCV